MLGTRAMTSTTSEETRRPSRSPGCLIRTHYLPVRQRQRPSSLASTSSLPGPPHRRQRQEVAPMRTRIAEIGRPVENARQTPLSCRKIVLRVAVSALHHRPLRPRRRPRRPPRRRLRALGSAAMKDAEEEIARADFAARARAIVKTFATVSSAQLQHRPQSHSRRQGRSRRQVLSRRQGRSRRQGLNPQKKIYKKKLIKENWPPVE